MKCGIYSIKNLVDGKIYIGQTTNLEIRKSAHFASLKRGKHYNLYLQRAFAKYGEKNFEFHILEEVSENMLDKKEREWIMRRKSNQNKFGYNLETGGHENHHHSKTSCKKMSVAKIGIPWSKKRRKMYPKKKIKEKIYSMKEQKQRAKLVSAAMAILGSVKSEAKAISSRANGMLGGRPKRRGLSGNSKQRRAQYRKLCRAHGKGNVQRDGTHVDYMEGTT